MKGNMFKEQDAKNRIEKSSFFNETSLESKATKLPQNYMEREESQISQTLGLKKISQLQNTHLLS